MVLSPIPPRQFSEFQVSAFAIFSIKQSDVVLCLNKDVQAGVSYILTLVWQLMHFVRSFKSISFLPLLQNFSRQMF
ncbi:hypothetical protein DMR_10530 [Solidesulfovibrio magneticus RS-1]|uniref:Uncharacterized protein n=1 Tax=Solidesulfovibrio magneticus (strain ATCC 700980 / DSM 13731 / RS-1) TaxID=573370 RepID=C4XL06_SOLM1|nr:hypothetical protein DMR_10530 [Solidesulfovibrio magneticus RS-1]